MLKFDDVGMQAVKQLKIQKRDREGMLCLCLCAVLPAVPTLSVTDPASGFPVDGSASFTLTCVTTSTLSTPKYQLYNSGTAVGSAQTSNAFVISSPDIQTPGSYECEASGDDGTHYSARSTALVPTSKYNSFDIRVHS